jgi:uncharacterized LabA/DUF88 family protein
MERVFAFVDGGHLRTAAAAFKVKMPDPMQLASRMLVKSRNDMSGRSALGDIDQFTLRRTHYFDGKPDDQDEVHADLSAFWTALKSIPDLEMGWGAVRGERRRQKRVDTLLSVAMLVGANQQLFETALLLAADEDFVPVVDEVRRLGIRVILGAFESPKSHVSHVLARSADRVVLWTPGNGWPTLSIGDTTFDAVSS